jgi:hypothetical protein
VAEGAGLDSGAPAAAQSAMPSIAACSCTDRRQSFHRRCRVHGDSAPRISTSLTDVTPSISRILTIVPFSWSTIVCRIERASPGAAQRAKSQQWRLQPPSRSHSCRRERTPPPRQSLQPIMYLRNAGHRELLLSGLDKAYRSDSVSVLAPGPAVAFD